MTDDEGPGRGLGGDRVHGQFGLAVEGKAAGLDRGFHGGTVTVALGAVNAENRPLNDDDRLPVKMLNDRILVKLGDAEGERRSSGGILIPVTISVSVGLDWSLSIPRTVMTVPVHVIRIFVPMNVFTRVSIPIGEPLVLKVGPKAILDTRIQFSGTTKD